MFQARANAKAVPRRDLAPFDGFRDRVHPVSGADQGLADDRPALIKVTPGHLGDSELPGGLEYRDAVGVPDIAGADRPWPGPADHGWRRTGTSQRAGCSVTSCSHSSSDRH